MAPGWTVASNDSKYRIGLHPVGSDNADDDIRRVNAPTNTTLVTLPTALLADQWQTIEVTFSLDHAIEVSIDGNAHIASSADSMLAGPFDIVFDFFKLGAVDNVQVSCTR